MAKLYDKDDPNQVKEEQSPYGAEAAADDSSPAAIHGRVVRLETNAQHVATKEGMARVEGKIDDCQSRTGRQNRHQQSRNRHQIRKNASQNRLA